MQLIPLTRPDKLQAAGLPFETTDQARWAFRNRERNGTAEAFVRLASSGQGRGRIYVDPDRFHELIRRGQTS